MRLQPTRNLNNYEFVPPRISPSGDARENMSIQIDFDTTATGFYLGIRDETLCVLVHRVLVFYYVCPAVTLDLITRPERIAPFIGNSAPLGGWTVCWEFKFRKWNAAETYMLTEWCLGRDWWCWVCMWHRISAILGWLLMHIGMFLSAWWQFCPLSVHPITACSLLPYPPPPLLTPSHQRLWLWDIPIHKCYLSPLPCQQQQYTTWIVCVPLPWRILQSCWRIFRKRMYS